MLLSATTISSMRDRGLNYGGDFLVQKANNVTSYPFFAVRTMSLLFFTMEDITAIIKCGGRFLR